MAVFNEPTKWQTSLVNSGDANVIPQSTPVGTGEASFDDGFPQITQIPIGAGGIAPDRKDFNGLFKILGDWIFFAQNGGLPTYSADFDYVVGRYVVYNNTLYKCIQANGASSTVVAPDSVSPLGTDYWKNIENQDNKADRDLSNVPSSKGILVESYVNGTSGYRKFSDGFCEQWGRITSGTSGTQVTFLVPYINTDYSISYAQGNIDTDHDDYTDCIRKGSLTQNGFIVDRYQSTAIAFWRTCGYIS